MSGITLKEVGESTIPTPATGKATVFMDDALGPAYKDDTGTVTALEGIPGQGVPAGGTAGQVLEKIDGTNYNTQWSTPAVGGDVVGPASSTAGNFAVFDDTTGKLLDDGGVPGTMAFIDDAPSDGTGYVRKDGAWAAESGGSGAVDSVNGQTGTVQIDAEDVPYDNAASGLTAEDLQEAIDELAGIGGVTKFVSIAMSDITTDITTGASKAVWFAPEDGELQSVFIAVHDPSSSGVVRVDMNDSGGTVFTTRPAIDATEATSLTGTNAVLDGTVAFSRGDKFTFDIDDAGTDARGLQACVEYVPA